jgi:hypothetical protein
MAWVSYQMGQVYTDYHISTPPADITIEEIRFFYMPMIDSLCKLQKVAGKQKRK